jgi:hypothetical protein
MLRCRGGADRRDRPGNVEADHVAGLGRISTVLSVALAGTPPQCHLTTTVVKARQVRAKSLLRLLPGNAAVCQGRCVAARRQSPASACVQRVFGRCAFIAFSMAAMTTGESGLVVLP